MTSEPATKAEVEAAIDVAITKAVEPLATKAGVEAAIEAAIEPLATKAWVEAAIAPLATKAELEAAIAPLATKAELEAWGMALLDRMERMIDVTVGRAVKAASEDFHRSLQGHAEQVNSDVAAANANTAQLRTEVEAHRDDAKMHRAPRRRRS